MLPRWLSGKESACNAGCVGLIDPWVGKIPWRRKWEPTPVFLPEISWTEEPGGLQSMLLLLLSRFSRVRLCPTPWTAAYKALPSMGFSRPEYWSGLPLPSLTVNGDHKRAEHNLVTKITTTNCLIKGIYILCWFDTFIYCNFHYNFSYHL